MGRKTEFEKLESQLKKALRFLTIFVVSVLALAVVTLVSALYFLNP